MDGLSPFSIEKTEYFEISFRKLAKVTAKGLKKKLVDDVNQLIISLVDDQRPSVSRQEPCPRKITLPPLCEFRKIEFTLSKGASGQIRLIYLVDFGSRFVKPLWISLMRLALSSLGLALGAVVSWLGKLVNQRNDRVPMLIWICPKNSSTIVHELSSQLSKL